MDTRYVAIVLYIDLDVLPCIYNWKMTQCNLMLGLFVNVFCT